MPYAAGLYYEEHGGGDGDPLILSSGLGGSAGYWAPNLPALAARRRVIAYDHRGTGRSVRDIGEASVEAMAADVAVLMDALGVARATIVGHALGGMIGLALALACPERVSGLVVVNGWAELDPHTARCFDTRLALLHDSGPRAFLHAQPLFLYPPAWISAHHDALIEEEAHQLAAFAGIETVTQRIAAVRAFAPGARLGNVRTRTLLIASEDDFLVPTRRSEQLLARLPNARLVRMARGGHACNVTEPAIFDALLGAWLDEAEE